MPTAEHGVPARPSGLFKQVTLAVNSPEGPLQRLISHAASVLDVAQLPAQGFVTQTLFQSVSPPAKALPQETFLVPTWQDFRMTSRCPRMAVCTYMIRIKLQKGFVRQLKRVCTRCAVYSRIRSIRVILDQGSILLHTMVMHLLCRVL